MQRAKLLNFRLCLVVVLILHGARCLAGDTSDDQLDFGYTGLHIPPPRRVNNTTARTVELLGAQLAAESTPLVRSKLLRNLVACERPEALQYLIRAVHDSDPLVRAEAARSIGEMKEISAVELVRPRLADADARVRREAVLALAQLGDTNAVMMGLNDPDAGVVAVAIGFAKSPEQLRAVATKLSDSDPALRLLAIESLARPEAKEYADPVAACLKGSNADKAAAIHTLAAIGASSYAPVIQQAAADSHALVRRAAIAASAKLLNDDDWGQLLRTSLTDADPTVRHACAEALFVRPEAQCAPLLAKQLDDPYAPLHDASIRALIAIGSPAIPLAAALLDSSNPRRREDGSFLLGQLRSDAALARHIALLNDTDWHVVAQTARSLGQIGNRGANDALQASIARIASTGTTVPEAQLANAYSASAQVVVAAARLGDKAALAVCVPMITEKQKYPPELRAACAYAFGLLGDPTDATTARVLLGVYGDVQEVASVKFEALKALGNVKRAVAAQTLEQISKTENDPNLRWIAFWAHRRITGSDDGYTPPDDPWTADVSISDLPGGMNRLSVTPSLPFGAEYISEKWLPLKVQFDNETDQAIEGYGLVPTGNESTGMLVRVPVSAPPHSRVTVGSHIWFSKPATNASPARPDVMVEWFDSSGKRLARNELAAQPIAAGDITQTSSSEGDDTLLLSIDDSPDDAGGGSAVNEDPNDLGAFAHSLGTMLGCTVRATTIRPEDAPRHRAGYDGCRFVLLATRNPDSLDLFQRQALLDHLTTGGVLILASPLSEKMEMTRSWLAKYLPVRCVDQRQADRLACGNGDPLDLHRFVPISEAILLPGAQRICGDDFGILAAYRTIGLGRVAFAAFPVNSLDLSGPTASDLWNRLLDLQGPRAGWAGSQLETAHPGLLQEMIGLQAAPWNLAAGIVAGYVLILGTLQLVLTGARRPAAFFAGTLVALAGTIILLGADLLLQKPQPLITARLTTVDIGSGGGGLVQESDAFLGRDDKAFSLHVDRPDATIRPTIAGSRPPILQTLPFSVPNAGVRLGQIERVWKSTAVFPNDRPIEASASISVDGFKINLNNSLHARLVDPLLVWGDLFPLDDIPEGNSAQQPARRNGRGDFTSGHVVATEVGSLRARIASVASESPGSTNSILDAGHPCLIAWLNEDALRPIAINSSSPAVRAQTMVRVAVKVTPPTPGSKLTVDQALMQTVIGTPSLPFDVDAERWITSTQSGEWLLAFRPIPQLGELKPQEITLTADVSAPAHAITLRRQQHQQSQPGINKDGPIIAHWDRPTGIQTTSFVCAPGDFDSTAAVWLLLQVDPAIKPSAGGEPPAWQFHRLNASLRATAISPGRASNSH